MRRLLAGIITATLLGAPSVARPGRYVGSLEVGDALYWSGPRIVETSVSAADCNPSLCPEFRFDVPGRGRLRVALDLVLDGVHDPEDGTKEFTLQLFDPKGRLAGEAGAGPYTYEVFVPSAQGTWTARVVPRNVQNWKVRMRAKLEVPRPEPKAGGEAVGPNLRAVPPFEFTFVAPATTYGPGISVGDVAPLSCSPLDAPADTVKRCLRFSAGPENAGEGVMAIGSRAGAGNATSKPAYQLLFDAAGKSIVRERRAGDFEFHGSHGHWHFAGYLTYELFAVEGASDDEKFPPPQEVELVPSSVGRKVGTCPVDERMADWRRVFQAKQYSYVGNCLSPDAPSMGLSPGWGDFYEWQRFEQYVEFPRPPLGDPDGYFVVRVTVDSEKNVLETREDDNSSYAYLRVEGDEVEIVERGYGTDPWDPQRRIESGPRR